jgi:succinyl-CoA synthetase alpha subunit
MSILVDENTKLIVQGITGREGDFHANLMKKYGTNVVGGVTPGKGGEKRYGIPVFDTVCEAVEKTGANSSILFVPPRFTKDAILEAINAGLKFVVAVAEGVPFLDMSYCCSYAAKNNVVLIGPNTPGVISPGKAKVGFMAEIIYKPGNVGIMSRSATLSYETVNHLSLNDIGQSSVVGIGGDPTPGSTFIDIIPMFEADPDTKVIVIDGEIGGNEEEKVADYIKDHVSKPVAAFIAGESAPKGKRMGHAGAIVSPGGEGSAQFKKERLRQAGVVIANTLNEFPDIIKELLNK